MWPVEINAEFEKKFQDANSPEDAKHLDQTELEEFKATMRKLFQLEVTEELTVWSKKKVTRNEFPLYTVQTKQGLEPLEPGPFRAMFFSPWFASLHCR